MFSAIRVLLFHGYLLRGTGSNVYNASLARAFARLGHEVHLFCQDRVAGSLPWVDRFGRWLDGRLEIQAAAEGGRAGSIAVYVPDIGGVLPVYVADRYEGFEVKTFPELTDAELDAYLDANVAAVREVVESLGGVDAAIASHLVMGPVILARAGLRFAFKVHGSDLSYTVLPHLQRFRPYAEEAASSATGILVSSAHVAARLRQAVDDPQIEAKVRLVPPGVDAELFAPLAREEAAARVLALAGELGERRVEPPASIRSMDVRTVRSRDAKPSPDARPAPPSAWARDTGQAAAAMEHFAAADGPRVVFVGKLIVSKGMDLLLAAWPLVHRENPGARLLVVGFGEYELAVRRLWAALEAARIDEVREIAARGRALEGGPAGALRMLGAFFDERPASYGEAARGAAGSVAFAGRLEHDEVGRLVPAADALVVPSTFPESFGMVAVEAAAAGVLPVSAEHSGLAEISRTLASELPSEAGDLVSFPLGDGAVEAIAERVNGWLALDPAVRRRARAALSQTARRLWSWEGVARGVLAASAGRLDDLPPVPRE